MMLLLDVEHDRLMLMEYLLWSSLYQYATYCYFLNLLSMQHSSPLFETLY